MKWIDCAEDIKAENANRAKAGAGALPFAEGVAFRSEDGRWRVTALTPERAEWCVWDMRNGPTRPILMSGGWRRLPTAIAVAEFLAEHKVIRVMLAARRLSKSLRAALGRI